MLILICDDLAPDRKILEEFCTHYAKENDLTIETYQFQNAGALLKFPKAQDADILFLDIYMEGASGIDAARILRGKGFTGSLIFTTTSQEHYADGFELAALHYLVKPVTWSAFCEAMRRCLEKKSPRKRMVWVNAGRSEMEIDMNVIRYVEVYGHKTILNTSKGEIVVTQTLSMLEQILHEGPFLKCYRSFLINMDYVQRIEGDAFLMKDNREIPISRDHRAQLKNHYMNYVFKKMEEA